MTGERTAVRRWWIVLAPLLLVGASILAGLGLAELLLRAVFNPGDFLYATVVPDPVLGQRIEPGTTGHDALGFRNREVPRRAGTVVLGDSQTYGVGVVRDAGWPRQLEVLLHEPLYNMALGGFGPLEEMYLAEHDAPALNPRLLVVGLYLGNDLADAYRTAHRLPFWRDWRESTTDAVLAPSDDAPGAEEPQKRFAAQRDWLARHCVLYGFLRVRVFRGLARMEKDRLAADVAPDRQFAWVDPAEPSIHTIFTPRKRLAAEDIDRADIQEGLRITKRAYEAMKTHAEARNIRLFVVVIPTKERVYCGYLKETGAPIPDALRRLCDDEERTSAQIAEFLGTKGIGFVDSQPALEAGVRAHVAIYPQDSDGHPTAEGYRIIARAAFDALARRGR